MGLSDHLDKLRAFKAIAETGKLRDAAKRLHMSQPSLTRLIHTLEESSNTQLLYRSRQGVSLTTAGQELFRYADLVLKELVNVEKKMISPVGSLSGHIQVGTYESLAEYLWPDFLRKMQIDCPDLSVSVRTNSGVGMIELLRRGEIDVVVDAEPRTTGDFISWPIYKDRFNFYIRPGEIDHELNQELVKAMTLIYVPNAFDGDERSILYHLESQGYVFSKKITLDSFTTAQMFCAKGLGLAVLPMRLQASQGRHNLTEPIRLTGFHSRGFGEHSICATIRSNQKGDPQISEFIRKLKLWFKVQS